HDDSVHRKGKRTWSMVLTRLPPCRGGGDRAATPVAVGQPRFRTLRKRNLAMSPTLRPAPRKILSPRHDRRNRDRRRRSPVRETLEARLVLSTWVQQGPGPILDGQDEGLNRNPVSGAIEAIAPSATDPNLVYVGAVNGGIWKTTNATAADPIWTPLTDQQL